MTTSRFFIMSLVILLLSFHTNTDAQEKRKMSAHVHGESQLAIVVEGKTMDIQWNTPADAILGFEHEPRDAKEEKLVSDAKQKLEASALVIVKVGEDIGCKQEAVTSYFQLASFRRSSREAREGKPATPKGHGDIHVHYSIKCEKELKGISLNVSPSAVYPKITKSHIILLVGDQQWSAVVDVKGKWFQL